MFELVKYDARLSVTLPPSVSIDWFGILPLLVTPPVHAVAGWVAVNDTSIFVFQFEKLGGTNTVKTTVLLVSVPTGANLLFEKSPAEDVYEVMVPKLIEGTVMFPYSSTANPWAFINAVVSSTTGSVGSVMLI